MIDRIDRSEYIKWLHSMISNRQSYHNHKETMAWVITALYVPGIIYLGYIEREIWRGGWEVAVGVAILVVSYLVLVFIKAQFDRRWEEAEIIRFLLHRLAGLFHGDELPRQDEWIVNKGNDDWAHFVQEWSDTKKEEERNCKAFRKNFLRIFPYGLKDNKDKLNTRWRTEIPSYLLIAIATIFAIILAVCN